MPQTSLRPADLNRAERIMMMREKNGIIAVEGRYDEGTLRRLAKTPLLKHRWGLVYEVTEDGQRVVDQLRAESS